MRPENLGKVAVELQSGKDGLIAKFAVNSVEVKEIFDNKQKLSIKLKYNNIGKEVLRTFGNGVKEENLYDKAGRIIVKMQKTERGELLWGEAYLNAPDGKRSATIDDKARITFYE